jgi:hypothetical protein
MRKIFSFVLVALAIACSVLVSGARADLLALYRFEGSTTADVPGATKVGAFSGQTYDGTALGNASLSANVPGANGGSQSLALDGAGDYVDLPINSVNPFDTTQDYTITAWFRSTDSTNSVILSSGRGTVSTDHSMALFLKTAATCCDGFTGLYTDNFYVNQVGTGTNQTPPINVFDGAWHFGAVTFNGATNTSTVYIRDGATFKSNSAVYDPAIPNIALDTVRIGGSKNTTFPGDGDYLGNVDDVAIFNHVLSPAELGNVMVGDFSAYSVPEPSTMALAAMAAAGFALVARRRRK